MNCDKCGYRMRIEENTKISEKEYKITYFCTGCKQIYINNITIT